MLQVLCSGHRWVLLFGRLHDLRVPTKHQASTAHGGLSSMHVAKHRTHKHYVRPVACRHGVRHGGVARSAGADRSYRDLTPSVAAGDIPEHSPSRVSLDLTWMLVLAAILRFCMLPLCRVPRSPLTRLSPIRGRTRSRDWTGSRVVRAAGLIVVVTLACVSCAPATPARRGLLRDSSWYWSCASCPHGGSTPQSSPCAS